MAHEEPQDPLSPLAVGATAVHELFTSFQEAGFTEWQALYLVGQYVHGSQRS